MGLLLHLQNQVFHITIKLLLISFLFLFTSIFTQLPFFAQGLPNSQQHELIQKQEEERVEVGRELIGSRPPRCEGRCRNCGHCEAIQVPVVPQQGFPRNHFVWHSTPPTNNIAYSRGDSLSNYKPMSWKCKCGNSIFNP